MVYNMNNKGNNMEISYYMKNKDNNKVYNKDYNIYYNRFVDKKKFFEFILIIGSPHYFHLPYQY